MQQVAKFHSTGQWHCINVTASKFPFSSVQMLARCSRRLETITRYNCFKRVVRFQYPKAKESLRTVISFGSHSLCERSWCASNRSWRKHHGTTQCRDVALPSRDILIFTVKSQKYQEVMSVKILLVYNYRINTIYHPMECFHLFCTLELLSENLTTFRKRKSFISETINFGSLGESCHC